MAFGWQSKVSAVFALRREGLTADLLRRRLLTGYFVRYLPAFWHAWAHWIDYETYAFQLLVRNDFLGLSFGCATVDGECSCTFAAPDTNSCAVTGAQVVQTLGYSGDSDVLYAFIL